MTESVEENYSSCCRLCLSDGSLNNIYSAYVDPQALVEKINDFLNVQITESDIVSKMLCEMCHAKITAWDGYKKNCLQNQTKLAKMAQNVTSQKGATENLVIQIKEEPADEPTSFTEYQPPEVKLEPMNEDDTNEEDNIYDLPPPLTPHPPETVEDDEDYQDIELEVENPSELVEARLNDSSKRQCSVCDKVLSTPGNRRKHEKCMHGLHGGLIRNSRKRKRSLSVAVADVVQVVQEDLNTDDADVDEDEGTVEPVVEKDRDKIEFAAGLHLQSKSAPVKQSELTTIEKKYLEKCRMMITMFETNVCACHNNSYTTKKLMGHLRSLYAWFPCYTCYNCMVTYDGRSPRMRHSTQCPRGNLEQLIHLSEMRARTSDKIRLYQNYKCLECNYLFGFYEDYCEHVDEYHVTNDGPYTCLCMKVFDNSDLFKQHIHKTCYLNYYCDICFLLTSGLDEFKQHCEEYHDRDEDFDFIVKNDMFAVYNNIEIGNVLLKGLENKKQRLSIQQQKRMENIEETLTEEENTIEGEDLERVVNPVAIFKQGSTQCIKCDKMYSSYHNMLRHLSITHGVTIQKRSELTSCDVCGNTFSSYSNMLRHKKIHNRPEVHKSYCRLCSMRFKTDDELTAHINAAHDVRKSKGPLRCQECGETFKNQTLLDEHIKKNHLLECEECNKTFKSADDLGQHRSVHLNITLSRDPKTQSYRRISNDKFCEICRKSFNTNAELQSHKRLHQKMPTLNAENGEAVPDLKDNKRYTCADCNKLYISYKSLWSHNKKHHPERMTKKGFPKDCQICQKRITSQTAWVAHKLIHNRPESRNSVHNNQTSTDSNDDSDYHTCKKCFKVFATKSSLSNHMRMHGINLSSSRSNAKNGKNSKTVWCNICHQACQGNAELNKHKMEHLNDESDNSQDSNSTVPSVTKEKIKHVYCKYCKIPFISNELLEQHMYEEHEEGSSSPPPPEVETKTSKKHKCQLCRKLFINMAGLASHMNWHKRTKTDKIILMQERLDRKENAPISQPKSFEYKCRTCGDTFKDDTQLQLHILEVHRNVQATYKCITCNKEFKSQKDCAAHEKSHVKTINGKSGVECKYCSKVFNRSDYLNIHISKIHPEHAIIGTFKCTQCDRAFEKQNALTIHLKVHERVSTAKQLEPQPANNNKAHKFECSICHFGFDVPKELREHIIAKHPF